MYTFKIKFRDWFANCGGAKIFQIFREVSVNEEPINTQSATLRTCYARAGNIILIFIIKIKVPHAHTPYENK